MAAGTVKQFSFSAKQIAALSWWCDTSPFGERDAIICDGAVRSGKTLSLSLSFALWALCGVGGGEFAMCGKTIPALRRNVVRPLMEALRAVEVPSRLISSQNLLEIGKGGVVRCSLFGGRDESSADLIQGATFMGVLLDEVALMPRSFVEQAIARCSREGAKFFFSCNPSYPQHWFYQEWIARAKEKNALYLHFTMADNPSLSQGVLGRYRRLYSGVFYQRFVLGKWVAAKGLVYPMFSPGKHVCREVPECGRYAVSCDYGTVNPASFGLWGECDGIWYRLREYYHDSRRRGELRTDEEYADALTDLLDGLPAEVVLVDPSAASFIQCLRRRGLPAKPARNDVGDGIRTVAAALGEDKLRFHSGCKDAIREFSLYRWDEKAGGDTPCKRDDHAMDDIRYFALEYLAGRGEAGGFWAGSVARGRR